MLLEATHLQRGLQNADEAVLAVTVLIPRVPANGQIGWTAGMENYSPQARPRLMRLTACLDPATVAAKLLAPAAG